MIVLLYECFVGVGRGLGETAGRGTTPSKPTEETSRRLEESH